MFFAIHNHKNLRFVYLKIPKKINDNYSSILLRRIIQLLVFMANELTVAEAFEKVKLFFQLKMNSPEVFRNRNPYSDEIKTTFQNQNFLYLPVTPDGYSVVYASLKNYSVSTFVFDSLAKAFFMTAGEDLRANLRRMWTFSEGQRLLTNMFQTSLGAKV